MPPRPSNDETIPLGGPDPDPETIVETSVGPVTPRADNAPALLPSGRFGDYELIAPLGFGGMGIVYKARHLQLDRVVALKMIRRGAVAGSVERDRFKAEAETLARLDHPQIVPIYEIGDVAGLPYFSMKLIEGDNLSAHIEALDDDPRAAARLIAAIARAVAEAHRQGCIHRDLKPANILIDSQGRPHVTDFGLAVRIREPDATAGPATVGGVLGTPGYMAPEQARGGRDGPITVAADIHGLGAMLYELLAGRPPFRGKNAMEAIAMVLERNAEPLSRARPGVPTDLEQICLRCLEKSPARRYESADALADDLDRFLRGEVVEAQSPGPWRRLRRWVTDEPKLAVGLGGLVVIELLILVYGATIATGDLKAAVGPVSAVMVAWSVLKLVFQRLTRVPKVAGLVPTVSVAIDMVLYTVALGIVRGAGGSLVIGYAMLVAMAALWGRAGLVWLGTGLAILGYAALVIAGYGGPTPPTDFPGIVIACLLIVGVAIGHELRRFETMARFYEE